MNLLTIKALFALLVFDLRGFGHKFPKLCDVVGRWPVASQKMRGDIVQLVCDAVNYACVWYPKRILCLQRSAVTTCLLRDYGVPAKMVMGAQTVPFKAHAWTEVDGRAINERRDVQRIYSAWERC